MSWIVPYNHNDFKWKDTNTYLLLDIRSPSSFLAGHIPYSINVRSSDLFTEESITLSSEEEYYELKAQTELVTPDASILPIYSDIEFTCGDEPVTQDVLIRQCKTDYTYFRMSVVTSQYNFQGKVPVIISYTCEDSIQTALGVMRATNSPVIVIKGGMTKWISLGLPVI